MTRYSARLEALTSALNPPREAALCLVPTGDDEAAVVARFRAANDWPDDGAHPVTIFRIDPRDLGLL